MVGEAVQSRLLNCVDTDCVLSTATPFVFLLNLNVILFTRGSGASACGPSAVVITVVTGGVPDAAVMVEYVSEVLSL